PKARASPGQAAGARGADRNIAARCALAFVAAARPGALWAQGTRAGPCRKLAERMREKIFAVCVVVEESRRKGAQPPSTAERKSGGVLPEGDHEHPPAGGRRREAVVARAPAASNAGRVQVFRSASPMATARTGAPGL
ncbi:unnamed protein product, partial [Amoebophrya sp. A120]